MQIDGLHIRNELLVPASGPGRSPAPISVLEHRRGVHGFALGIDRLTAGSRVFGPMRNQTPSQRVERYRAGLMIASDYQQLLARRGVPARRIIVRAAVAGIHAIDNGVT